MTKPTSPTASQVDALGRTLLRAKAEKLVAEADIAAAEKDLIPLAEAYGLSNGEKSRFLDGNELTVQVTFGETHSIDGSRRASFETKLAKFRETQTKAPGCDSFFSRVSHVVKSHKAGDSLPLLPKRLREAFDACFVSKPNKPSVKVVAK